MTTPVFFAAPHRVMFAGGALQLLITMGLWGTEMAARYGLGQGLSLPWPAAWIHGGLMMFGLFPWFIFGFLMTALPKWMQGPAIEPLGFLGPFACLATGWSLLYLSLGMPTLALPAVLLAVLGMAWGSEVLRRVVARASVDKRHGYGVVVAVGLGTLGLAIWGLALLQGSADAFRWAVQLGVWGFLTPVFFTVIHRMLPFFSSSVIPSYQAYAPMGLLGIMLACFAMHGLLAGWEMSAWTWGVDTLAAVLAFHCSGRWGLRASLKNPMLAVLHLGALWLGIAMALLAVQSLLLCFGRSWGGLWPFHAVVLGFFGSVVIGMSTRVTRGHSGMVISEDRWVWPLFWMFQGVVLLRGLGEWVNGPGWLHPFVLSAALWLVVFGLWVWQYFPHYFRPRQDGLPG